MIETFKDLVFQARHGFKGFAANIHGDNFRVDVSLRRWNYDSEQPVFEVIKSKLRPGDVFVDVGANFGMHTLSAAENVGAEGHVFAFEPIASNIALLSTNIGYNNFDKRVTIMNGAVSDSPVDTVVMARGDRDIADNAAIATSGEGITVPNFRLDDLQKRFGEQLRLMKVDVEGAELAVLRSGYQLLGNSAVEVIVEMHPGMMGAFGYGENELVDFMSDRGYASRQVGERTPETYQLLFEKSAT